MGVMRANIALDEIPKIEMNAALKTRLLAECRFLRAFYYFELTTLWGAVPLLTKPIGIQYSNPRTPVVEVDKLIEEDFKFAVSNLPKKREYPASELGRATQGAAKGFLGKFYLYKKRYAESAAVLKQIIDSGEYDLVANYRDNATEANENNVESLFEVQFKSGVASNWGDESAGNLNGEGHFRSAEFGLTGFNNVQMSEEYATLMGNDPRSKYTFYQYGTTYKVKVGTADVDAPFQDFKRDATGAFILDASGKKQPINGYSTRKYNKLDERSGEDDGGDNGINFRVLRFADVLLMYAEAVNEVSGPTAEVYAAINRVRNRPTVNVGNLPTGLTKEQMFEAIVKERALELALEQSRAKDLRRWNRAGSILRAQGKQYRDGVHNLLPIPQKEIDANESISPNDQNPGY
jgi:tetratricopeptide (TPR) repeat protein